MFDKIIVPSTIKDFMCNKLVDFISTYVNNRISDNRKNEISSLQFEREFRKQLVEISDKIENLEAIVYQELQLFNKVMAQLTASNVFKQNNTQIMGNIYITININCEQLEQTQLMELVSKEASDMFLAQENNDVQLKNVKEVDTQEVNGFLKRTLEKANNKLKELRKDE